MQVDAIFKNWFALLAQIFAMARAKWLERNSVIVTREDEQLIVRPSGKGEKSVIGKAGVNMRMPDEALRALRNHFIVFDLPFDKVVTRHVTVPAQAREFVAGIVGNQIERLSPWPLGQMMYGDDAGNSAADMKTLNVSVVIAAKATVDAARDELTASGLTPNRIRARVGPAADAPFVTLWNDAAHAEQGRLRDLPKMIGVGLAVIVSLSAAVSLWALYSMNSAWSAYDDTALRASILRQRDQMARSPQQIASLAPAERAWALKQRSPAAVVVLDELARALPDSAYLTNLRLEGARLHIVGMADDAPSLISALEKSHHFTKVQFFAPTIKSRDNGLYRFSIAARLAPYHEPERR